MASNSGPITFHREIERVAGETAELRIACHDFYRAWLGGRVLAQGPARAAPGYARVDRIPLPPTEANQSTRLIVEVSHDTFPRYDRARGTAFLAVELVDANGEVKTATGADPRWCWADCGWRVAPMEKFSMQRGRIEAWRFPSVDHPGAWGEAFNASPGGTVVALEPSERPVFLSRRSPLSISNRCMATAAARGTFRIASTSLRDVGFWWTQPEMRNCLHRGEMSAQAIHVPRLLACLDCSDGAEVFPQNKESNELSEGEWLRFGFGGNRTGFPLLHVVCSKRTRLLVTFDELLIEGNLNPLRNKGYAAFHWELAPGQYCLRPFDPYCLQWLQMHVLEGGLRVDAVEMDEFANPVDTPGEPENERLASVHQAAWQTFRQNSLDIFMDCPGRERAGWLCDSFFTARAEYFFTGENQVELDFLENFHCAEQYGKVPEGLLPMCWPADNPMGQYIPQWALWFVLEVADAVEHRESRELAASAEGKIRSVLAWFDGYRDADGFVADLPGWNFVEWSKANDLTVGVNFPTQFLLGAALAAAGELYGETGWIERATCLRKAAADASFDGTWFRDQALRSEGILQVEDATTETCQYYAFFFGAATPASHPHLWKRLIESGGPERDNTSVFPELHPSNAFIGNLLRFHCLARHGESERLREEVLAYYAPMAEQTSTLWEHNGPEASCNHGFAAAIAPLLAGGVLPIPGVPEG